MVDVITDKVYVPKVKTDLKILERPFSNLVYIGKDGRDYASEGELLAANEKWRLEHPEEVMFGRSEVKPGTDRLPDKPWPSMVSGETLPDMDPIKPVPGRSPDKGFK